MDQDLSIAANKYLASSIAARFPSLHCYAKHYEVELSPKSRCMFSGFIYADKYENRYRLNTRDGTFELNFVGTHFITSIFPILTLLTKVPR